MIIFSLWRDKIKFADELTELHFKTRIAFVVNGATQAELFKRYKDGEDIDLGDHGVVDNPEYPLIRHQKFAAVNALATDGYAYWMEQGTGKTASAIATVCNFVMRNPDPKNMKRVIVVCPNNVRLNWETEMQKFATEQHQVVCLRGTKMQRVEQLLRATIKKSHHNTTTVVIVGYDTLKMSLDYITKVEWDIGIADEAHYFKTPGNKRAKAMLALRDICKKRLGLTGTPITNSALDLYMQFEWLGRGYSGFTNFRAFKRFYGQFVTGANGFEKLVGLQNKAFMQERMARLSFIVRKAEALPDLPTKIYDVVEVEMSKPQKAIYKNLAEQLAEEIEIDMANDGPGKQLIVQNILTKLLKLAQVTSGFIVYPEIIDEDGNIEQARSVDPIEPNPKLEALIKMLKERDVNSKSIVWACWIQDIETVSKRLTAEGIGHVTYYGATSYNDRLAAVEAFNTDPNCTVFLANPAAASTGITLLGHDPLKPDDYKSNCDHVIYYSQNWSMVLRNQSEDRPHRVGTRVPVRITDLCVPQTIDEDIRAAVLDKITNAIEMSDLRKVLSKVLNNG